MPHAVAFAKLARPRLEGVCPRPRLFRRLDEATRRGAAWVEGPPGCGKTTLVASFLERRKARTIWYRIDEADADVATFFHYLGAAAARVARARAAWPRFQPDAALDVAAFARHWFRAVYAALGDSFALALDDYHETPPRSPLHAVVRAALSELPGGASAIVMSRSGPPPTLARLRANGSLALIGPEELQLTAAESRAIVRLRGGRTARRADALHARAGGWAAGLTLLLAAEGDGVLPATASGGLHEIFDYFAGEVLDRSDPATQRVLLETALLPQVSDEAAKLVTGVPTAGVILAELARRGYFTTRHATGVYTYHPLFREFLVERARGSLPPRRLDEVRLQAARVVAGTEAVTDAVALLREAGALEEAAQLVRERAGRLLSDGRAETLRQLICELPATLQERDAWLSYWLGMAFLARDVSEARPALERAYGLFTERGESAGAYLACAAILDSYGSEWTDFRPLARWIAAFGELRRSWPDFPNADVEARAACGIYTALSSTRPDDPELPAWQERVAGVAASGTDAVLRTRARFALAHFATWRGDLAAARTALGPRPGAGGRVDPWLDMGWLVQSARGAATSADGAAALELAEEALALARNTGNHWWDPGSRLVGAWAATLMDDVPRAEAYLRALEQEFDPTMDTFFEQARGLVLLRSGDRTAARERLTRSLALDEEREAIYPTSWDHTALAAIARAEGDEAAFARHLGQAERLGALTRSHIVRYWTLLLRAAAAADRAAAAQLAARALRLSREAGPFDEMWVARDDLAAACALALGEGLEALEARAIIGRRRLEAPRGEACDAWPWPVAVRTLGRFALDREGVRAKVPERPTTRPIQLFEALIALGGVEVPEWKLTDALWPDAEADAAQHALEMNLSRLRKLLGTSGAILQRDRQLSVEPRVCWVDALALEAWLAGARPPTGSAEARRDAARALALYRRPFLEDDESGWARAMRERLRRRMRAFGSAVALALRRAGCEQEAQELTRDLARRDPELAEALAAGVSHGAP